MASPTDRRTRGPGRSAIPKVAFAFPSSRRDDQPEPIINVSTVSGNGRRLGRAMSSRGPCFRCACFGVDAGLEVATRLLIGLQAAIRPLRGDHYVRADSGKYAVVERVAKALELI